MADDDDVEGNLACSPLVAPDLLFRGRPRPTFTTLEPLSAPVNDEEVGAFDIGGLGVPPTETGFCVGVRDFPPPLSFCSPLTIEPRPEFMAGVVFTGVREDTAAICGNEDWVNVEDDEEEDGEDERDEADDVEARRAQLRLITGTTGTGSTLKAKCPL